MADEGELFEGLRLGSRRAFDELLDELDPTMRRLARLYVPDAAVPGLVRRTWSVALPGLDMFTWHTTLRAWLVGILLTYGRAAAGEHAPGPVGLGPADLGPADLGPVDVGPVDRDVVGVTPPDGPDPSPDPTPWRTLAWSEHWHDDSWKVLEDSLADQPLARREVLWLHDVEGWPRREVLDACGVTAQQGDDLLHLGRSALARAVAAHVGAAPVTTGTEERDRLEGVALLLERLRPVHPDRAVDPELVRVFTTWRRHHPSPAWRRWRWDLARTVRPER